MATSEGEGDGDGGAAPPSPAGAPSGTGPGAEGVTSPGTVGVTPAVGVSGVDATATTTGCGGGCGQLSRGMNTRGISTSTPLHHGRASRPVLGSMLMRW